MRYLHYSSYLESKNLNLLSVLYGSVATPSLSRVQYSCYLVATSAGRGRLCYGQPSQGDEETRARLGQWVFGIFYLRSFLFDCKTTIEKRFVLMALYLVDSFITMHDFHHPNPLSEELPIWSVLHGGRH